MICPACQARLKLDHFKEEDPNVAWWYDLSDKMGEQSIGTVVTTMPCCQKEVHAIYLEFDWPAGFARFEMNVMNPNVVANLATSQLHQLETIFGCQLRQVRAYY